MSVKPTTVIELNQQPAVSASASASAASADTVGVTSTAELTKEAAPSAAASSNPVEDEGVCHGRMSRQQAVVFTIALIVHSILDGLGVGAATDSREFYALMAALLVHKGFDGFSHGQYCVSLMRL